MRHFVIKEHNNINLHVTCIHYILKCSIIYVDIFGLPCVDTQTVNFTLRSTLHNIFDFGLVVDGVTFYDCSVRDK